MFDMVQIFDFLSIEKDNIDNRLAPRKLVSELISWGVCGGDFLF